ncbi:endonuclease/exonuclease/phosphatase family protein [Candidatus Binatus sp.]|jgi:endonuclease/exonuclease/phosphatase family metal-dependent hydrolase|uniref:endonuclease/exonuclease/phosphatase family protein n=1 Tax=Candidatus Binatus sp. TaxID=2811406 RepID=UPI003BC0F17E
MDRDARDLTTAGAKPTPYFPPIVVNRAARRRPQTRLRVVLLNAAGGRKFREILACLKRPPLQGADVILLCEVTTGMKRMPGRELATELAEALEMSCAYVREFGLRPPGIESEIVSYMGNAILSAAPFEEVGAVAMHKPPTPMAWPRGMRDWSRVGMPTGLVTRVKFGGEELTVGVAHLHSRCTPAERARQMATYLESFPAAGRAIFGGDLNTTTTELSSRAMMLATVRQMIANPDRFRAPEAYEPLFDHLRERGLEIEGANVAKRGTFTFSGLIPRSMRPKLDWLAVRELRPIAGTAAVVTPRSPILLRRASDHDFVTVDLEL